MTTRSLFISRRGRRSLARGGRYGAPQRPLRHGGRRSSPSRAFSTTFSAFKERVVGNDNTGPYEGRVLQIPQSKHRRHFVKAKLRLREYGDGALALFHGLRKIAACDADGALVEEAPAKPPNARKSAA